MKQRILFLTVLISCLWASSAGAMGDLPWYRQPSTRAPRRARAAQPQAESASPEQTASVDAGAAEPSTSTAEPSATSAGAGTKASTQSTDAQQDMIKLMGGWSRLRFLAKQQKYQSLLVIL